jgi:hypothetical protein
LPVVKQELSAAAAVLLACVFAIAGASKLRRPALTSSAIEQFGLPTWLARPLPYVELLAAALLAASPRIGGGVALVLLSLFTMIVIRTLNQGRVVRCGCFGSVDDRPIGAATIVRNVALLVGAGIAGIGRSDATWPSLAAVVTVVVGAASVAVVVALVALRSDTGAIFPKIRVAGNAAS